MLITKADGTTQQFDPHKLTRSLRRAGATQDEVAHILAEIERTMTPGMTTRSIFEQAFTLLQGMGKPVASRYLLRRAIVELGPTGFPFEDFITRLFDYDGYKTQTRLNIRGACAMHEIDVAGHKGDESAIIEVKFHKNPGFKSDLQVTLYSYARYLDVQGIDIWEGKANGINALKIVTNTKFTTAAIEYATCKGISLLSWGYPHGDDSIEARVEKYRMFPVTILMSLTPHQKMLLLRKNIVLCADVANNIDVLHTLRFNEKTISAMLKEIEAIMTVMPQNGNGSSDVEMDK